MRSTVYPRVCGGTDGTLWQDIHTQGLSPRVRGNRTQRARIRFGGGSIPACAGEPQPGRGVPAPGKVYPRVCGGTSRDPCSSSAPEGLSPRVRGNQAV